MISVFEKGYFFANLTKKMESVEVKKGPKFGKKYIVRNDKCAKNTLLNTTLQDPFILPKYIRGSRNYLTILPKYIRGSRKENEANCFYGKKTRNIKIS